MFQDDRMISVLSAIVLMIAIGTVIQRADLVGDYFGGKSEVVLNMDVVDARANRLLRIDVFQNDTGVSASDRDRLVTLGQPSCGQVFIQGQALQYLPDTSCIGQNFIEYGIQGNEDVVGKVIAQVNASDGQQPATPKETPAATPEDQPAPQIVAAAPAAEPQVPPASTNPTQSDDVRQPDQTGQAGVVDTLIQGAAQSAQAASGDASVLQANAKPDLQQEDTASEPVLADPAPRRAAAAILASPKTGTQQTNVAKGQSAAAVAHSNPSATLEPYPQTQPARAVKPQITVTAPALQILQPQEQRPVEQADGVDLASVSGAEQAPRRALPSASRNEPKSDDSSGFLVAVVERREPSTQPPSAPRGTPGQDLSLQNAPDPSTLPSVEGSEERIALADPVQPFPSPEVAPLAALPSSPVDDSQLPLEPNNVLSSTPPPLKPRLARAADAVAPVETQQSQSDSAATHSQVPQSPTEPQSDQLAALPRTDAPCVIPPAMTIDVRRAARSIVSVDAPCHADTVAELQYSGLRVALPLDRFGKGALNVLGFEPNAPALLSFVNGEKIDFDLPFKGIGRVSRIAVVWDLPVQLELNAVEFGAGLGSQNHVRPDNPRRFEDVRRSGGGFLDGYRSHSGIGQNAQIYSFWHRRGGQQGVVELMIDYASRNRDRLEGTCGDGAYAAPNFLILRSVDARLNRPVIRKLAALDCSRVVEEKGDKRLISGAVADLLVVQR